MSENEVSIGANPGSTEPLHSSLAISTLVLSSRPTARDVFHRVFVARSDRRCIDITGVGGSGYFCRRVSRNEQVVHVS